MIESQSTHCCTLRQGQRHSLYWTDSSIFRLQIPQTFLIATFDCFVSCDTGACGKLIFIINKKHVRVRSVHVDASFCPEPNHGVEQRHMGCARQSRH